MCVYGGRLRGSPLSRPSAQPGAVFGCWGVELVLETLSPPPPPPPGGRCCEEASCTASVTLTLQQERRHSGQVGLAPGRALQPVAGTPREVECPRPPSGRGDACYQAPRRACRAGPWLARTQPGSAQQPPPCVPPPHPTPGDSDTLTFAPSVLKLFPFNPRAPQGPWL